MSVLPRSDSSLECEKSSTRPSAISTDRPLLSPLVGLSKGPVASGFARAQASPSSPRHRGQPPRGQDGDPGMMTTTTPPSDQVPGTRNAMPDTPLLMGPPLSVNSPPGGSLYPILLSRMYESISDMIWQPLFSRLVLFLLKMLILARPCLPFMFNFTLGLPLVLLAGLDLGLAAAPVRSPNLPSLQAERGQTYARGHWIWGHTTSLALFAVHILLVWAFAQIGILCPSTQPDIWNT